MDEKLYVLLIVHRSLNMNEMKEQDEGEAEDGWCVPRVWYVQGGHKPRQ